MIYFIRSGGAVKIGTSNDLGSRFRDLQSANPEELHLLHREGGGLSEERAFHRQFDHLRIRGEWFRYADDLQAFLEGIPFERAASNANPPPLKPPAPLQGEWVSVVERRPDTEEEVLVYIATSVLPLAVGCLYSDGDWSIEGDITHWMRLPMPPVLVEVPA